MDIIIYNYINEVRYTHIRKKLAYIGAQQSETHFYWLSQKAVEYQKEKKLKTLQSSTQMRWD